MFDKRSLTKTLLLLTGFVLFSANTIYFVGAGHAAITSTVDKTYHFDFDSARERGPNLNLKAALLVNYDNGKVLYAKNCDEVRPIASLSKLVAAMVILDQGVRLDTVTKITNEDARGSGRSRLRVGYELTVRDLLHASLMISDNRSTRTLARVTSGSIDEFVREMNRKVKKLGLEHTVFYDPTGLDERNVSTAHEVAKILHHAFQYDLIADITAKKKYLAKILNRKNAFRQFSNTNLLVQSPYRVLTGKTGYIIESDYCLAAIVKNGAGERLTVVVLGVPGDKLRFKEARRLLKWGFTQLSKA
jgi:D-alanyl-D-alanine endopeptidase (penicillin-binding protein 7)